MLIDDAVLVLEPAEKEALRDRLAVVPPVAMNELDGRRLAAVASRRDALPPRLTRALSRFAERPNEMGALLVRNLPLDERLPATPADGRPSPGKASRVSEYVLVTIASCLGEVVGYREEKDGMLVHDVCPQPGREERQENSGSRYFEIHTENAFHPLRPDHVVLLCLRGDRDGVAETLVAPAASALQLPAEVRSTLRKPWFRNRMPTSFAAAGDGLADPAPVVTGPDEDPRICVDAFNTVPVNDAARAALDRLVTVLRDALVGAVLEPGDLLVVDNRRAVHARTGFVPRYDGRDRWLQRVFTVADWERTRPARRGDSHVCALEALASGR